MIRPRPHQVLENDEVAELQPGCWLVVTGACKGTRHSAGLLDVVKAKERTAQDQSTILNQVTTSVGRPHAARETSWDPEDVVELDQQ